MTTAPPGSQTFLQRVRQRVLVPLTLAWAISSALVIAVSYTSTAQAFDQALLDQAYSVLGRITLEGGHVAISSAAGQLTNARPTGLHAYALYEQGHIAAGDADLEAETLGPQRQRSFRNANLRDVSVRCVTVRHPQARWVVVVAAQDMREREEWLKRLVAYSITPQLVLLLVLGWWLRHALADEVAPLTALQRELEQRDTRDLQPLPAAKRPTVELSMLTAAINGLLMRIDRSVQAQRQFAGDVAHEIRTPLARVRGTAEQALASNDEGRWRDQMDLVVKGCDRAARVVEQLLSLAIAAEARETLQLEPINLDEVVRGTVLQMLPQAEAAGVDLGADGLDEAVQVIAQRHLMEGLLRNLIDNALRYGRPAAKGQRAVVTVALTRRDGVVQLSVTDNGPGIEVTEARRLVSRWERGRHTADRGGTGLGLSIVARYCELMGTQLSLQRASQGGLEASVLLREVVRPIRSR